MTLTGAGLNLRPLTRRDREEWNLVRWENRDWLAPWESQDPRGHEYLPTFGEYVRIQAKESKEGTSYGWVITEGGPILGHVTLSQIYWGALRSASIGYWVSHHRAGEGITPRAVALVCGFGFDDLELNRIEINIRPENTSSLRVVEKLGFRYEGMRERFIFIDGDWRDHHSFALTYEEGRRMVADILANSPDTPPA